MGAVTAIMYAKRNSMFLSSMILDSPFSDIEVMVNDIALEYIKVKFVTSIFIKLAL